MSSISQELPCALTHYSNSESFLQAFCKSSNPKLLLQNKAVEKVAQEVGRNLYSTLQVKAGLHNFVVSLIEKHSSRNESKRSSSQVDKTQATARSVFRAFTPLLASIPNHSRKRWDNLQLKAVPVPIYKTRYEEIIDSLSRLDNENLSLLSSRLQLFPIDDRAFSVSLIVEKITSEQANHFISLAVEEDMVDLTDALMKSKKVSWHVYFQARKKAFDADRSNIFGCLQKYNPLTTYTTPEEFLPLLAEASDLPHLLQDKKIQEAMNSAALDLYQSLEADPETHNRILSLLEKSSSTHKSEAKENATQQDKKGKAKEIFDAFLPLIVSIPSKKQNILTGGNGYKSIMDSLSQLYSADYESLADGLQEFSEADRTFAITFLAEEISMKRANELFILAADRDMVDLAHALLQRKKVSPHHFFLALDKAVKEGKQKVVKDLLLFHPLETFQGISSFFTSLREKDGVSQLLQQPKIAKLFSQIRENLYQELKEDATTYKTIVELLPKKKSSERSPEDESKDDTTPNSSPKEESKRIMDAFLPLFVSLPGKEYQHREQPNNGSYKELIASIRKFDCRDLKNLLDMLQKEFREYDCSIIFSLIAKEVPDSVVQELFELSATYGHSDLIKALVEKRDITDIQSAFETACITGKSDIVDYFLTTHGNLITISATLIVAVDESIAMNVIEKMGNEIKLSALLGALDYTTNARLQDKLIELYRARIEKMEERNCLNHLLGVLDLITSNSAFDKFNKIYQEKTNSFKEKKRSIRKKEEEFASSLSQMNESAALDFIEKEGKEIGLRAFQLAMKQTSNQRVEAKLQETFQRKKEEVLQEILQQWKEKNT